jgi:hypothetical protein
MFTDSVQDASHRAGFFRRLTYRFNPEPRSRVRSALQRRDRGAAGRSRPGYWARWQIRADPPLLPRPVLNYRPMSSLSETERHRGTGDWRSGARASSWETVLEMTQHQGRSDIRKHTPARRSRSCARPAKAAEGSSVAQNSPSNAPTRWLLSMRGSGISEVAAPAPGSAGESMSVAKSYVRQGGKWLHDEGSSVDVTFRARERALAS